MQKRVPIIHETADELKQRLKEARDPARKQRLHALYLLASGQARFRTDAATMLGVDRRTVGRWLELYARNGLDALLDIYVPAGKQPPLAPDQLAKLQEALERPEGFASYGAIQAWIARELGVALGYHSVHTLVHDKLGAKPKVPRPAHQKKR